METQTPSQPPGGRNDNSPTFQFKGWAIVKHPYGRIGKILVALGWQPALRRIWEARLVWHLISSCV